MIHFMFYHFTHILRQTLTLLTVPLFTVALFSAYAPTAYAWVGELEGRLQVVIGEEPSANDASADDEASVGRWVNGSGDYSEQGGVRLLGTIDLEGPQVGLISVSIDRNLATKKGRVTFPTPGARLTYQVRSGATLELSASASSGWIDVWLVSEGYARVEFSAVIVDGEERRTLRSFGIVLLRVGTEYTVDEVYDSSLETSVSIITAPESEGCDHEDIDDQIVDPDDDYGEYGYGGSGYDDSGYDDSGYDDSGYDDSGYDDSGYDDSDYDDSDYDDSDYDDSDDSGYDNSSSDDSGCDDNGDSDSDSDSDSSDDGSGCDDDSESEDLEVNASPLRSGRGHAQRPLYYATYKKIFRQLPWIFSGLFILTLRRRRRPKLKGLR